MIVNRLARTLLAPLILLMAVGCQHNTSTSTTNPAKLTPFQHVIQWNDALAQANQDVAKGVIAAQQSGTLTVAQADTVLTKQRQVADYDEQLTKILQLGPQAVTNDQAAIKDMISKIQGTSNDLLGDYGVKNATNISQDVGAVLTMANDILQTLIQNGLIK